MSATGATVRDIVANKFGLSVDALSHETSFIQDLNADSLDKVELIMLLQEAFQLEIMDAEAEELMSIGDAEAFVEQALSAKR